MIYLTNASSYVFCTPEIKLSTEGVVAVANSFVTGAGLGAGLGAELAARLLGVLPVDTFATTAWEFASLVWTVAEGTEASLVIKCLLF